MRARAVQVVRRRRRRRSAPRGATGAECGASACGLTPKEAAAAAAATEATCARHRRHATVSSASLRSPWGRRAIGRVGARRFDAAGVSNAAPTGTEAQAASHRCRPGCGVRRRPAPAADPPGCLGEASVGGVRGFRSLRARAPRVAGFLAGLGFARTALLHLYPSRASLHSKHIQHTTGTYLHNLTRGHTYTI